MEETNNISSQQTLQTLAMRAANQSPPGKSFGSFKNWNFREILVLTYVGVQYKSDRLVKGGHIWPTLLGKVGKI